VRSKPPHLRFTLGFWEDLEGRHTVSLLDFEGGGVATGRSIAELQALYDRIVWVDSAGKAQAFSGEVRSTQ
jgi:hypothetical protein